MGRLWGWASGAGGGRLVAQSPVRGVQDHPRASCLTLLVATRSQASGALATARQCAYVAGPAGSAPGARACARLAELKSRCPAGWAAERPV